MNIISQQPIGKETKKPQMKQHEHMVSVLAKPGQDIKNEMTGDQAHLIHMAIGIAGEAGEIIDAVKKNVIYRKELDRENLVEELGDLEFYMEGLRQAVGITREECLEANIIKLSKRYDGLKYTDQRAIERADKNRV